jgi:molybdopterin molybdotransferase
MREMIQPSEAKLLLKEATPQLNARVLALEDAAGLVLADDIKAVQDIPAFPQSAMDGYAFSYQDWEEFPALKVNGQIAAGSVAGHSLARGYAVRIFTGAAVPEGADTVVMQEKVRTEEGHEKKIVIEDEKLQRGGNVRPRGSEIKAGQLALRTGSNLSPATIGFLAGIGIHTVNAIPLPRVSLLVTGNELQIPGNALAPGQVFESNSFSLRAALGQLGIKLASIAYVRDDLISTREALKKAIAVSDLVLVTGGVSVGEYDFVVQAAQACGVKPLFHRIRQRPGKPLFAGKSNDTIVMGLPGNPSSVLTCFYEYVSPVIGKMTGRSNALREIKAPLATAFHKMAGLTHFVKGFYDGKMATPLTAQESYRMSSYAHANCLIQIDETVTSLEEGSIVEVHLLPDY